MPTISAGNTAEIYCPLASSVTFTPGSGGTMKLGFSVVSGSAAIAPQTIGTATSITVSAGATVFAQAVGVDATYTAPAGVDTALQALVSDAWNALNSPTGLDVPCTETSGGVWKDVSDCQNNISARTEIVAPHANAGYISSEAGASKFAWIPSEKFSVNMETDSFFLSFVLNMAAPGANSALAGFAISTTYRGLYFSLRTSGEILPIFWNAAQWTGALSMVGTGQLGVAADGTDHTVQYEWCAKSRTLAYRLDGVLRAVWHNEFSVAGIGSSTGPLAFGAQVGIAGTTAFAAKFKAIKARTYPGKGLPLNIAQIARTIYAAPFALNYLADVYPEAASFSAIAWIGQSNEAGASDQPDTNGAIGAPARDGVLASGTTSSNVATAGSMHPAIASLGGKRRIWRQTYNTAIGATSLLHYWVGAFVGWAALTNHGKGAYCVAAGKVFKFTSSTNATNTVGVSGSAQPTWPGSGTVVDGDITWTYVRASTAADVIGSVIQESNALFDPNGAFAAIKARLDAAPSVFAGRKVVCQSHGQSDQAIGATQTQYSDALRVATRWCRANGYSILIGLTNSGSVAGVDTWLASVGAPARAAVLAEFASDAGVGEGSNTFDLLGTLAVQTNAAGVLADGVHMNRWSRDRAAAGWDARLAAKGF